ncbi:MAG: arginine--tRNA ligase [Chitinophagaceae bacterium]|jgi:arginyl-tRNA synthetase|nr:arginine--tRNA ligase [Chitinophagaceae bacterium]
MLIIDRIRTDVSEALHHLYGAEGVSAGFQVNQTRPEFEGDYTIVLFSLVKALRKSPEALAAEIGEALTSAHPDFYASHTLVKGFMNLTIRDAYWIDMLSRHHHDICFGKGAPKHRTVMVEYSSPNTNKPLHLGHLRNNFLGWSIAEILRANGYDVVRTCIVNDRGVHICKSMIAWQRFANGATPASTGMKGDHLVGDYYVKFNDAYKAEVDALVANGMEKALAEKEAPIMKATQEMLIKWEQGDPEVMDLWKRMNGWVYEGFDETYRKIGSHFDKTYYESETYLLGKDAVAAGLEKGVFFRKEDGSVWIDLTADGLDEKLLLRKDGTSVYITQDIGLAMRKFEEYRIDQSIYVIGDEQNYHMKVLRLICQKLGLPYADGIHHLSYGMVELPTGKMKSREGTVVDADDLVAEMVSMAEQHTRTLGKVNDIPEADLSPLFETLGLGALKFYLLRVDPKKKMIFNPEESIEFHGFTGPFVQYTYARIRSILRKIKHEPGIGIGSVELMPLERSLLVMLEQYGMVLRQAADEMNPSLIGVYAFNLAREFNSFYAEHSVANAESEEKRQLRLRLSEMTSVVIASALQLLGIRVPERM